jgi:hypothetical protein
MTTDISTIIGARDIFFMDIHTSAKQLMVVKRCPLKEDRTRGRTLAEKITPAGISLSAAARRDRSWVFTAMTGGDLIRAFQWR